MKKNLFLLFSIYFFVVQPVIVGVLRGQANFFRLGAINLVAILLIAALYAVAETSPESEKIVEKKPMHESKVAFHDHFHTTIKEHKKRSELAMPAIISFVVAIIIFFMFQYNTGSPEVMLVFALSLGFIVFISLTFIFKHRITKSFRQLFGTKIYIILLIISIALTAYDYSNVHKDYQASFKDYLAQNFLGQDRIPTDGYVFTGEGTILGSGMNIATGTQEVSSDIFSGTNTVSDIQEATGTVLDVSTTEPEDTTEDVVSTSQGKQKIMDAVVYLVKKYKLPLVTSHDIAFTYVSTKNPYYNERRTAYANKMIGKTTNPSKYIVCESYIVMKGLAAQRGVQYTSANVLSQFWNEAIERDALNGCKKGYIVDVKNL